MLRGDGNNLAAARFKILGPLGAGGFGAVYEAIDARTGQQVAVKQLDDTSAESIARFKHEFRALADCHHENLVGLKELIEQDGRWLIVMELVPGMDFLRYVQRPENDNLGRMSYDELRLRGALAGMVEGLRALHGFGILHRDLKPSNVRVRPDGRAVLLDFGLATSVDPMKQSTHAMGVGTVIYMAPEQAGGQSIGPACDLYALGVCLFEALTGRAPFEGDHAIKVLLEKQRLEAPRPSSVVPQVPTDLDELCARLLAIDPAARPSAEEVLGILTKAPVDVARAAAPGGAPEEVFAGREAELAHLERALARTHNAELRVVLVEGESGVGKSELVGEFLRRARRVHPELLALRGRCYENEQVSYKAFDGCIDELAKVLRRMPEPELKALLPERAALLGQLFPVLRNVKGIANAPRDGLSADPSARRLEAFSALAHLLSKLAEERPVVLVLDDMQWADAESFRLLAALNQDKARPPILLTGTVRPREELETDVRARLEEVRKWQHSDVVPLFGLPHEQAKALAKKLLPQHTPDAWLETIADESQGHPLFMSELIQYTQSHDFAARGSLTLEAALRARIDRLERRERELLEIVAIAARPHPLPVFASALSTNLDEVARSLLKAKLLRLRRGHELGCYHDRIRHAAVALIAKSRLPVLHHQLASALMALPNADASEQAHHWDLSGQQERASGAYEEAANKALDALAFTRAAELFERAILLLGRASDERVQRLRVQRADALAFGGRSAEAAKLYQEAADAAHGDARIKLRSRAALHLILSAKVGAGYEAARTLLAELGFSLPRGVIASLLRYGWEALRVALSHRREPTRELPQRELVALGVVREMLYTVGIINPLAYVVLAIQYVRRAEHAGSSVHRALALTTRGWFRALHGSLPKALPLIERGQQLVSKDADPLAIATQAYSAGSAHAAAFDWPRTIEYMELAQRIVQEQCPDNPWLLTSIRYHLGSAWYYVGESQRTARELERWIAEARERNDTFAVALLVGIGYGFSRHLLRDRPEAALEELESSAALIPAAPYSFPHLGHAFATLTSLLYRGGSAALHYLDNHEAQHKDAFLLKSATGVGACAIFRAFSVLASYVEAPRSERPALLKQAKEVVALLRRTHPPHQRGVAAHIEAQIAALEGQRERALTAAREALAIFSAAGLGTRRAARYLVGTLEGGRSGRQKCAEALTELRAAGWDNPLRAVVSSTPVLPLLGTDRPSLTSTSVTSLLLGRYEVVDQLGSGGFGAVVAARDPETGRMLAIKELTRRGAQSIERFKLEFRALSSLPHENIVQLESLFEHEGRWYIAMELVEGVDLISYVRESGRPDPERLRSAFAGAARGLSALHQSGFVHRDLKPENVLVTAEGRAVLIDFGLSARAGDTRESGSVGSAEYAGPEQLAGRPPTPAADVHALGACLYYALMGRPPFGNASEGPTAALLRRTRPVLIDEPAFADVAELCTRMLAEEPAERPLLGEVLRVLTGGMLENGDSLRPTSAQLPGEERAEVPRFLGRAGELARLEQTFSRRSDTCGASLIVVEGESGLGKSELVREFARRAGRRAPPLEVLRGRCYENEQIAFKAFDAAVDQIAKLLRGMGRAQCEALLPKRAALLAQLFPVLATVPAIAEASRKGLPAEPTARKQAGRDCFVELLAAMAQRDPLLLLIDDLQWADGESFELLRALLRLDGPTPLWIVCTVRPLEELESDVRQELAILRSAADTWLTLGPLDEQASGELARQLAPTQLEAEQISELVRESKGHPLFLRELVAHAAVGGAGTREAALSLDAALAARIAGLSKDARELLGLVAIATKPHGSHAYARALGRRELPREALLTLLQHGLLQRRGERLACYHDRIRHAALALLDTDARKRAAHKLAAALNSGLQNDAAERARLWDDAGEPAQALDAYEQAGDLAIEALAFARAEQHYARALELLGQDDQEPRARRLLIARAHALVGAGRSAQAARLFQRAASGARGEEAIRLRLWAAQHLLQSAQVEEGLSAARQLLSEFGVSLPRGERAAKLRIAWERLQVKRRGIEPRLAAAPAAQDNLVLEVLRGLSAPVRAIALLPGSALIAQYLRRALDAGQAVHAARGLGYEAFWRILNSPQRSQDALLERSAELAERTGDPPLIAEIAFLRGYAAIAQLRYRAALSHLWRAHDILQTQCPEEPWLLTSTRVQLGHAWTFAGNFAEIQHHMGTWIDEARARDDHYAIAAIAGNGGGSLRHAMQERPDLALVEIEEAMAPWPRRPFGTTHYGAFSITKFILGSEGGPRLLQYLERNPEIEHASLMRTAPLRFAYLSTRIHGLLLALEPHNQSELVPRARADVRALGKLPGRTPRVLALAYAASIHQVMGDRDAALACLRESATLSENIDHFSGVGVRYMLALLEGGDSGRKTRAEIRAQIEAEGWKNWQRGLAIRVPGSLALFER